MFIRQLAILIFFKFFFSILLDLNLQFGKIFLNKAKFILILRILRMETVKSKVHIVIAKLELIDFGVV